VIYDTEQNILADLIDDNQQLVVAAGGRGGFGNAHFVSSVRQAQVLQKKVRKPLSKTRNRT